MTPKNPFEDPEHPIDYNIRGKDVKEPANAEKEKPETPLQNRIVTASYKGIEFEPLACRKQGASEKMLFYFNNSLVRLTIDGLEPGFERHPRPQEALGLIMDGIKGKLVDTSFRNMHADMLSSYGEWFSMAFERKGNILIAYLDPEGLVWNSNTYVKNSSFKFVDKQEFDIAGKKSNTWIPLDEFSDDLVQAIYGRKFKDLPQEVREGNFKARMSLPPDGAARPVGRADFDGMCNVYGYYDSRASRGVRTKK